MQSGDVTNDGKFKTDVFLQQEGFYNAQLQNQPNELYQNGQHGVVTGPLGYYNYAYQETDYEASPLNRTLDTYAPGVNWAGTQGNLPAHNVQNEALVNVSADNVQMWSIAAAQGSIPTSSGAYAAGTLHKSITIDEQMHQVITYTDLYGEVVLKKVQNSATPDGGSGSDHPGWLCTYSVYDDYGNLRFVIPPAAVTQIYGTWTISQTLADELCYRFEYDALNRMVIRKNPGTPTGSTGEVWMVYDVRNRLVMVQDGNLRAGLPSQPGQAQWLCYVYDALDRPTITGVITSSNTLATMQQQVTSQTGSNSSGTLSGAIPSTVQGNLTLSLPSMSGTWQAAQSITLVPGFSSSTSFTATIVSQSATPVNNTVVVNNNPIPSGLTLQPLSAQYYDNYNWLSTAGTNLSAQLNTNNINGNYFNTSYYTSPVYAAPIISSIQTQGMPTGSMTTILAQQTQNLFALPLYDEIGHLIQVQNTNFSGGRDITTTQYDWSGKPLSKVLSHSKGGTNPQTHLLATANTYDAMGRLLAASESVNSSIGSVSLSTPVTTVSTNQYNERNMIQQVSLGSSLETQQFDYNLRGWVLGMNRNFAETVGTGANYFGYALGYDYNSISAGSSALGSFDLQAFNGSTAGVLWKSKGDNQIRKYDYSYDATNRLAGADFNQFDGAQFDKTAGIDYSVSSLGYDDNGNINDMNQNGWILGGSQQIDQLKYHYLNGAGASNQLQYVEDLSAYNSSNPASTLGDFHYTGTKGASTNDYGYDDNGNIKSDANRLISSIVYNYLNLPYLLTMSNGEGTVEFDYDAMGNKLKKITIENNASVTYNGTAYPTNITTTTSYIDGFVYKSVSYSNTSLAALQYTDKLQFLGQEQGRIRALYSNVASPNTPTGYAFDYYIRDNQQNVRMVLTDEKWQDTYPAATLEPATIATEENYYSITDDASHVIVMATNSSTAAWWQNVTGNNYPDSNTSVSNPGDPSAGQESTSMYRLNGSTGDRFGLGITLKVMAGDQVSIFGKSVWHNAGVAPNPYPLSSVLANFLGAFAGTSPVSTGHFGVTGASLDNSGATTTPLMSLLSGTPSQPGGTNAPKAAINWILFNDQFVPVSMGTDLVSSTGDIIKVHAQLNLPMACNGYLYVYCSNETDVDVFFDNLQVVDTRGPILEEDHYYPVGLEMAGISDHAWNKLLNAYRYQGKELQDQEFSNGTGLAQYDFGSRFYDQQLGRWQTYDPATQYANPYMTMGDSWPNGVDPTGKSFWSNLGEGLEDLGAFVALGGVGYIGASLESGTMQVQKWNNKWWEGAIVADVLVASAAVEVAAIAAPAGATSILGLSPAATSIAEGAATGVFTQMATTMGTNFVGHQQIWQWDQEWKAAVAGAALGAWSGANPEEQINPDGTLSTPKSGGLLGLRTPAADEGLASAWENRTLYNLVSAVGGSIATNWINNNPLLSKINIPIGPTPFDLTLGKGQVLFNLVGNAESNAIPAVQNLWGILNNLYPSAYYYYNFTTFNGGMGGDNVWSHFTNYLDNLLVGKKINNFRNVMGEMGDILSGK